MYPTRWLALVLAVSLPLWAAAQPPDKPDKPEKPSPPKATESEMLLDAAIAKLEKMGWTSTTIRQSFHDKIVPMACEGELTTGPGRRVGFVLKAKVGQTSGESFSYCDGTTVYRGAKVGGDVTEAIHYSLSLLDDALKRLDDSDVEKKRVEEFRAGFRADLGFDGIRPRLQELRRTQSFTGVTYEQQADGTPVYRLDGEWRKDLLPKLIGEGKDRDSGKPYTELWYERPELFVGTVRRCRVYLGRGGNWRQADSLWPYRIEWLGRLEAKGSDAVIFAIDYATPTNPGEEEGLRRCTPSEEVKKAAVQYDPSKEIDFWIKDQIAQQRNASIAKPFDPTVKPRTP
jgi:hypothetical protein